MSKKTDLRDRIKRRLGYPMIKVEVHDDQISDNIEYARSKFLKYAAGQATQEVFFTMLLSAGQYLYEMPGGVVDVISYDTNSTELGSINTLFTLGNYLYSEGFYDAIIDPAQSSTGYSLLDYHVALDFLETIKKYHPDPYNFKYHKTPNLLEIQPPPPSGNYFQIGDYYYDSPGFILIRAMMISGSTLGCWEGLSSTDNDLYDSQWVHDYALALTKQTLGIIRRKFANFSALGNQGTALDGADLITEGKEEIEKLEESLILKEVHIGWPVMMGSLLLFLLNYSIISNFFGFLV